VSPATTVLEAMRIMTEHHVRHLPVIEENRMVGLVSIGNLVNWVISAQHAAIGHLEDFIRGAYPG
jgi:CBS domain-containing protein